MSTYFNSKLPMGEFVAIFGARYERDLNKLIFEIFHSGGCGTYYNYKYKILDKSSVEKWISLAIFLETDNTCEQGRFIDNFEMDFPQLPFKAEKLIFNRGSKQEIIIELDR